MGEKQRKRATQNIIMLAIVMMCMPLFVDNAESVPMPPLPIGGRVLANGIPANGLHVIVTNMNNSEASTEIVNERGYYTPYIYGRNGDIIRIIAVHAGVNYTNQTTIDISHYMTWLNLSIEYDGNAEEDFPPLPPDDNDTPPPPPPIPDENDTEQLTGSTSHSPSADFYYEPRQPKTNETVRFYDNSIDENGDIVSWEWTIQENKYTGQNVDYIFKTNGTYQISLKVYDSKINCDVKTKTMFIERNETALLNETNETKKQNVTIIFNVMDEKNKGITDRDIEIYQNGSFLKTIHTDGDGIASTQLAIGKYTIKMDGTEQEVIISYDGQIVSVHFNETQNNIPWILYLGILMMVIGLSTLIIIYVARKSNIASTVKLDNAAEKK